ncbi:MAG: hypothetical protein LBN11_03225 [Tannerella sp.]|jgi:hypothetical protein|nr:hypothetical protein [Tannerella sp.]
MKPISKYILIAIAILAFTGCEKEDFLTSHPDEGGVVLTADWSDLKTPPQTFQARVISSSGSIRDFENLQGASNSLVVEPGEAVVYVFNKTDNIAVTENKAKVSESLFGGISSEPGTFYSDSKTVTTEKDRDTHLTATMKQQTGDLKLSLAIMPAEMIGRVHQVKAVMEGVSSELNLLTNELSATSFISTTLTKSSFYASANLRLLGFNTFTKQNLKLEVTLDNGDVVSVTSDVTQFLTGFNDVKKTPQSLSGTLHVSETDVTVGDWKRNTADSYLSLSPLAIALPYSASESTATVTTDQTIWTYSIVNAGDWLTVTKADNRLTVRAVENVKLEQRKATVNISTGGGLTGSIEIVQEAAPQPSLSVSTHDIILPSSASDNTIDVTTNQPSWTYDVVNITGNWLTVSKTGNVLTVRAVENIQLTERKATVRISTAGLTENVIVTQQAGLPMPDPNYRDKEVVKLQTATVGKGIPLVLMGDGYTEQYMQKGSGKYETDMRTTADHFFSVYPMSQYRNYFNVYMVVAISNQEGISIESPRTNVDTKFESIWEGGGSTGIDCNTNIVREYVSAISELTSVSRDDITVVLPINKYIYAGTTWMYFSPKLYAQGFSIALCPVGAKFKEIVVHEAAGHGFAKLADEYIYYPTQTYPAADKAEDVVRKTRYDVFANIDFYSDIMQTTWSGFSNNSKYSMVSTFEGASYYGRGIWRPEFNSCMNENDLYFNAPSRWAQVKRIMHLAGISYSFAQFLQEDVIPAYPAQTRSSVEKFVPLGRPKMTFE